jgi:hypothetical protein
MGVGVNKLDVDGSESRKIELQVLSPAPAGNGTPVKGRWDRINALDIDYLDINGSRHQHRKIVALGPQPPSAARKRDSGERTMGGWG